VAEAAEVVEEEEAAAAVVVHSRPYPPQVVEGAVEVVAAVHSRPHLPEEVEGAVEAVAVARHCRTFVSVALPRVRQALRPRWWWALWPERRSAPPWTAGQSAVR
jgi:hypothetical protein